MRKGLFILTMRGWEVYKIFFSNRTQEKKIINFINTKSVVNYELIDWIHEVKDFEKFIF